MTDLSPAQLDLAAGLYRTLIKLSDDPSRQRQFLDRLQQRHPRYYEWVQSQRLAIPTTHSVVLGRYRLTSRMDRVRADTDVWRGTDLEKEKDNHVVVKVYRGGLSREDQKQLAAAYGAIQAVTHPNVVKVLDHGINPFDGTYCVVTKWVGPKTLANLLESGASPSPTTIADWMAQLGDAVATVHEVGVLHGDLKPSNVVFAHEDTNDQGDPTIPVIIDWDGAIPLIVRRRSAIQTWNTGTEGFAAPEQRSGKRLDPRTDVYGLASILYAVLTNGRAPVPVHPRGPKEWRRDVRSVRPDWDRMRNESEPLRLIAWCGLRKVSRNRYSTAAFMKDEFIRVGRAETVRAPRFLGPYGWLWEQTELRPKTVRSVAGGLAFTLLFALAISLFAVIGRELERSANRQHLAELDTQVAYSPESLALADKEAVLRPHDPTARIRPFVFRLTLAQNQVDRNEVKRGFRRSIDATPYEAADEYAHLLDQFVELHRLVSWSVEKNGGLEPNLTNPEVGDEAELIQAVSKIDEGFARRADAARILDSFRPLFLLRKNAAVLQKFTLKSFLDSKAVAVEPPEPFGDMGFRFLEYWRTEEIPHDATNLDSAELCYLQGAGHFLRASHLLSNHAAMPRQSLIAKSRSLAFLRNELAHTISFSQRARQVERVTPATILALKAWALEVAATITLLRNSPQMPDKEFHAACTNLVNTLHMRLDGPQDAQLLTRVTCVVLLGADRTTGESHFWSSHDNQCEQRFRQLKALGRNLLKDWESAEQEWLKSEPTRTWNDDTRSTLLFMLSLLGNKEHCEQLQTGKISPNQMSVSLRKAAEKMFQ